LNARHPAAEHHRVARVIGVGELLWDLLPTGRRLGGAPLNTVAHLARLGFDAAYVSAVGSDELGRLGREALAALRIRTSFVQEVEIPTGVVRVAIDRAGTPEYDIVSPAAYEAIAPLAHSTLDALPPPDILVFGTLAQRFPGTLATTRQLSDLAHDAIRLYDVNLRDGCWSVELVHELLGLATILKVNESEADVLAREFGFHHASPRAFSEAAANEFNLRGVCVTRGSAGATLLLEGVYRECPGTPVRVVDTVGAGDAFSAGLAAGLWFGWPTERVLEVANRLGSIVAAREGAIPHWDPIEVGGDPNWERSS
jgi:fructokinase